LRRSLLIIGASIIPIICHAQEAHLSVSPFWGYRFGGEVIDTPAKIRVADHSTYGLRIDYDISPTLAAELEGSRNDSHLTDSRYTPSQFEFRQDSYLVLGKITFPGLPIAPYVALGGGLSRIDTLFALSEGTHDYFTGTFAAGLEWFFCAHVGARLDGRLYATDIHGDPIGATCTAFEPNSNGAVVPVECARKNWLLSEEASLGLVLRF